MIIKNSRHYSWGFKTKKRKILFLTLLLTVYSVFIFYLGITAHRNKVVTSERYKEVKESISYFKRPFHYFKSLMEQPETIAVDIKFQDHRKLAYMRERALAGLDKQFDYVNATLNLNGQSVPVKMRLKGDRKIHYEHDEQWSFRVKTVGEQTVFGMKWFSLHKPRARNYVYEWLFHEVLKREKLISLRYKFVNLAINGKSLGLYALEEHFGKRLVEYNQLREGPIVRFNERYNFDFFKQTVEPFERKKFITKEFRDQLHHAASLLEGFRSGKLKVSEAFDEGKLAVYFAVTDVLGMRHGAIQKSLKFYYNPITRKLEPIGYDGHFSAFPDNLTAAEIGLNPDMPYYKYHHYWFHKFFNDAENFDEVFFKKYVKALERMTRRSYMATLFKDIDGPLQKNIAQMFTPVDFPPFRDYVVSYGPELFHFDVENLKGRRHAIRGLLTPRKGIPAYYKEFIPGGITLEAANTLKYPVRILGLEVLQGTKTRLLPVAKKTILPATTAHRLVHYRDIPFQFPPDFHWKKDMKTAMTLKFRVLGSRSFKDSLVFHWRRLAEGFSEGDLTRAPGNIAQFDFLEIDERNREIHFKPGTRELSSDLVIPAGYSVFAGEGVRLELRNSAVILSRSPLIFTGTEESPVVIISPDSTGGGLVVMEAGKESLLEHVYFENLRNPSRKGWVLTGAVTFYKSPVKMVHCLFKKNRSEDALNIVSGTYRLEHTRFVSTSADALDCDFSKGHIVDCYFNHCGNDAIDISGGSAEVLRVTVDNACDKGLSAGEGSRMTAEKVTIKNTAIAVTAKDSSRLIMKGGTITDCRIGVTAFQKKPEFGPASIIVNHVKLKTIEVPWLVEKGSPVRHNGKQVAGDKENVKNLLYGKKYGKSSE